MRAIKRNALLILVATLWLVAVVGCFCAIVRVEALS
jgi:hypothetical protein